MTAAVRRLVVVGALVALTAPAGAAEPLQPFQMVRSLQLVQDRIAAGDHAALPMQKKLLEMIDQRFRDASAEDFQDKRNFRAVLVYGMSGGNPATLKRVLSDLDLKLQPADARIGNGILGYVTGQPGKAKASLADANPLSFAPELGSFVALVKGSLVAIEDPKGAMPLFDQARLLAPGTLVEEAALRRSIALSTTLADPARFLRASDQYVRRYLRSPYASQFADAFVAGVIALQASLKLEDIGAITALMSPEQEKVIYLRIARRAVIEGLTELSAYASQKAEGVDPALAEEDPRALLYASLASVTSADVPDILQKLDRIDRSKLTASDRGLLDAVRAVATEVASPVPADIAAKPDTLRAPEDAAIPKSADHPDAEGSLPSPQPGAEGALPPSETAAASDSAGEIPDAVNPADAANGGPVAGAHAEPTAPGQVPSAEPPSNKADPEEAFVFDAREKLDAIDKLLNETR